MKVIVKDANILISLLEADLLDIVMNLGFEIWTTEFVVSEIELPDESAKLKPYLDKGSIKLFNFDSEALDQIMVMSSAKPLSTADCSVYLCSEKLNGTLLTSDRKLKNFAIGNGIDSKGLLWLFDEMIKQNKIDPRCAADKLEHISQTSMWLPIGEVNSRISKWRSD